MRQAAVITTILNGFGSVGPQILALLLLASSDYGRFSVAYLVFALAQSVTFSVLCDPWVIVSREEMWAKKVFPSVLVLTSSAFAVFGGFVAYVTLRDFVFTFAASICILLATYRGGARYFLVHSRKWSQVLRADVVSIVGLSIGGAGAFVIGMDNIYIVFSAWALASLGGVCFGPYPVWSLSKSVNWFKKNCRTIRPLLADSLVMEASAVGTPFVLLPLLGVSGFGIYRGVSNLSSPVRLLLAPIRPVIVSHARRLLSIRWLLAVMVSAFGFALLIWSSLLGIAHFDIQVGIFTELSQFKSAAGVYVGGAVLLSVFPLVARAQRNARLLFAGRIIQTCLGIVGPLWGYVFWGLEGAIWGSAMSAIVSGIVWLVMTFFYAGVGKKDA